jgi:hypothetical protein
MHWDNECRHSRQGERKARVNFVQLSPKEIRAQDEYDTLYYELDSKEETGSGIQSDFCRPLQSSDFPTQHDHPIVKQLVEISSLEGPQSSSEPLGNENISVTDTPVLDVSSHKVAVETYLPKPHISKNLTTTNKSPLNRRSHRRLACDIARTHYSLALDDETGHKPIIELKRIMARPPGCSFLGSRATQVPVSINSIIAKPTTVIVDSGSDITLILHKALLELQASPKIKQGQRINLVQVTGNTSISGFVVLDLYFLMDEGPVKIEVEAYVVKGMSTPLILGNNFADKYSISVLRIDGETRLELSESGRQMKVENSVSPLFMPSEKRFDCDICKTSESWQIIVWCSI